MSDHPPAAPGGSNEPQGQANDASGEAIQAIVLGRQDPEVKPEVIAQPLQQPAVQPAAANQRRKNPPKRFPSQSKSNDHTW